MELAYTKDLKSFIQLYKMLLLGGYKGNNLLVVFLKIMLKNLMPKKCCDFGEYKCTIPMAINGRVYDIDLCISDIIAALNAANIKTYASCCGHNKINGTILLEDGRILSIKNPKNQTNGINCINDKIKLNKKWKYEK